MSWTSDEVLETLTDLRRRGGDSTFVEVKRATGGVLNLIETLCAFGNMPTGGTILLGVDEATGFTVLGVTDVAAMEAGVAAQARGSVKPPVQTSFQAVDIEGKQVVVVDVDPLPSVDKPCRARGRAYLRQADGDYQMSDQEIAQVVAQQDRPRYDTGVVSGSSVADLDPDLTAAFLADARNSSRRLATVSDNDVLRRRGVVTPDGLTVAGLYALGSYPQQFAPSLSVTAAATGSGGIERMADLAHFDGPIPDLLTSTVEWVARNTRNAVVYGSDGNAVDRPEIPNVVVREIVANALVHRDLSPWTQSKRVEVRLLADRLVVTSPGGLWGVSEGQLGLPGGKSSVNEFLYDICRSVRTPLGYRIIEGEGGGIREVREVLAASGLAEPVFIDTGVSFTVLIYRPTVGTVTSPRQISVLQPTNLQLIEASLNNGDSSVSDLMAETGLSRRQVKYAIDQLVAMGVVTVNGGQGNRFTVYRSARVGRHQINSLLGT